jgi:hypothetical protein
VSKLKRLLLFTTAIARALHAMNAPQRPLITVQTSQLYL